MRADLLTARRTSDATPVVRHRREPNALASAVLEELNRHHVAAATASVTVAEAVPGGSAEPVVVHVERRSEPSGPVLVALDDDANSAALTAYGLAEAARRGVALRTVYVWTDCRPPDCDHHCACHSDLSDAAQLLADIIEENLSTAELDEVERDVLHDIDPGSALSALSASASLLVVGASSRQRPRGLLGETTRRLLADTRCPLAVVPTAPPGFPSGMRRPARTRKAVVPDRSRPSDDV
jgi:nucleotide-binding universal stress UspA family protein